jgi:hypothetical protein
MEQAFEPVQRQRNGEPVCDARQEKRLRGGRAYDSEHNI